ncbi:MAG: PucC family protein, partial [Shimia sp.]
GLGVVAAAWGIRIAETSPTLALWIWIVAYAAIGLGIGAGGTSFLALLSHAAPEARKGPAATLAWLFLIMGAIAASVGAGIALDPYTPTKLVPVVVFIAAAATALTALATLGVEGRVGAARVPANPDLRRALAECWADPAARRFTGFVFLSILAFYLSELIFEPFAGHVHGLTPDASTRLSGGKDGAALLGMIAAGTLSAFGIGTLRSWAVVGCGISSAGLLALGAGLALVPSSVVLGLGNGLFVVGAVGSMMQLAAAHEAATGTRMGVFGAAQAIAAGVAGLIATATLDLARIILPDATAYATIFTLEAALFGAAALMAARVLAPSPSPTLQPGE